MKYVSVMDSAAATWDRMMNIFFRPFDLGKWFIIGFTAWLADVQLNLNFPNLNVNMNKDAGNPDFWRNFAQNMSPDSMLQLAKNNPVLDFIIGLGIAVIVVLVVIMIIVSLVMLWLKCRGKFMFISNLAANRSEIVAPWRNCSRQGNSLFIWQIALGIIFLLPVLLFIGIILLAALPCMKTHDFSAMAVTTIIFTAAIMVIYIFVIGIFYFLVDSFVVPIMFKKNLTFLLGLGEFSRIFMPNIFTFIKFAVLYIVLHLAAVMLIMAGAILICCICCCVLLLFFIPYLSTVLLLPFYAYFRLFSLEVLARIDKEFDCFAADAA